MKYIPTSQPIVSPEDQSATFVELFFDLVFVFSVTQLVGILHHGLNWASVGQAVLVFWLVWWAWTQFTWALNSADTTHHHVELSTLTATAVAFFMAIAVPEAFQERALWFAIAYVIVRAIGLILYTWVSSQNVSQRTAVRMFALLSLGGLAAVLVGGFIGGTAQYWLWGLAILFDIIAAIIGARSSEEGLNLHPEHFGERHGLFVIIALGETLIVAGSGVIGEVWTENLIAVAILAVGTTCGFWWSYFHQANPALERALASHHGTARGELARDVFSLLHFPMLLGVIAFSFAIEEAVIHPGEPLSFAIRFALALGLALFVGGMVVCMWRATRLILWTRAIIVAITVAAILLVAGVTPSVTLAIAFTGIVLIAVLEQRAGSPLKK